MARAITAAAVTAVQGQRGEYVHLLALEFGGGTVRFTTGSVDLAWDGETWSAAGSAFRFDPVAESGDLSGQRVRLTLDGVSLGAIAALLGEPYVGRLATLYRAHLASGVIVDDPVTLFVGFMNSPWQVVENPDERSARVETELSSPLAVFDQVRGITADLHSHRRHFAGDGFFRHILDKPEGDFGWGIGTGPVNGRWRR